MTTPNPFLATNRNFDIEYRQMQILWHQLYTQMAYAINSREISDYLLSEIPIGQHFFKTGDPQATRAVFRKVFPIPATASGTTATLAHGIKFTEFTNIYGTVITDVVDYRPIPYISVTAVNQGIELQCDTTNVYVINGAAAPNITSGIVVLEYLQT